MNEKRILALAQAAGATPDWDTDNTNLVMDESTIVPFAELLINRCLAIMENECDGDLDFAVFAIKKEFGL